MNPTNIILIAIIALILIFAVSKGVKKAKGGCCAGGNYKVRKVRAESTDTKDYTYRTTMTIDGMTCVNCKTRVENAFNRNGHFAKVELSKKKAIVYSKTEITRDIAAELLEKDGYTLTDLACERL